MHAGDSEGLPALPELHCASGSSNLKRQPGSLPTRSQEVYPGGAPLTTVNSLLSLDTYAYTPSCKQRG